VLFAKFKAMGKSAHGSMPWLGDNPIEKLMEIYRAFKARRPQEPCDIPDHWHETVNIGKIQGGDSPNRVPDYAEMTLDFRFPGPKKSSDILKEIEETLSFYENVEFEVLAKGEPVFVSQDHPFVQEFKRVAEEVLQREVIFGKEHGATDGRYLAEKVFHV